MQATINRPDNIVVVDGLSAVVDCSTLPAYVSVIQWDDGAATKNGLPATRAITPSGWIEFVQDSKGLFLPNCMIVDFAPYQYLIDAYNVEYAKQQAERDAAAKALADHQAHMASLKEQMDATAQGLTSRAP